MLLIHPRHRIEVADVLDLERDAIHGRIEVRLVAGETQIVDHDDARAGLLLEQQIHEVRADKATAAGYQICGHSGSF